MSAKTVRCPTCIGTGKRFIYHNGVVIDSSKCVVCKGTGRVKP